MRRLLRGDRLARAAILAALLAAPHRADAQAWVPTERALSLTADYSFGFSDQEVSSGESAKVRSHYFVPVVDFTPIANLGLRTWVPFVLAGCADAAACPHLHPSDQPNVDDGSMRFTLQDLNFEARYMFDLEDVVTLAPILGFSFPLSDYPTVGHAVAGRAKSQIRIGLNAGRQLAELLSGLFIQARYQFAYILALEKDAYADDMTVPHADTDVDRLRDIALHRSRLDFELGYFIWGDLSVRFLGRYEATHGGISLAGVAADPTAILNRNHDVLAAERYFLLGGSLSYVLADSIYLSATYWRWIDGANTRNEDVLNFAVSYTVF